MIALLWGVGVAWAEPARVALSVGADGVFNDTFQDSVAARVGVHLAPVPWVEVGASFSYAPEWPFEPASGMLSKNLPEQLRVSPDISRIVMNGQAVVRVRALSYQSGAWTVGMGALGGAALVNTQDDDKALQVDPSDPYFTDSANQIHLGSVIGAYFDIQRRHFGVRARVEHMTYSETINAVTLEHKSTGFLGAEVFVWL